MSTVVCNECDQSNKLALARESERDRADADPLLKIQTRKKVDPALCPDPVLCFLLYFNLSVLRGEVKRNKTGAERGEFYFIFLNSWFDL
jgi:hypothetical protein